jgi:hypothetical protein
MYDHYYIKLLWGGRFWFLEVGKANRLQWKVTVNGRILETITLARLY